VTLAPRPLADCALALTSTSTSGSLPVWAFPAAVVLAAILAFVVLLVRRRVQAARRR
jgi:membrane protein implicated in regulation of membrane protease activity